MANIVIVRESEAAVVAMPNVSRFDLIETDQFRDEIHALASNGETRPLLVDLSQVDFLVSATLGVLAELTKQCSESERRLAFIRLKPKVQGVIETCAMDRVLTIFTDEDEAVAAL
jgi:anti-anti-sigma factor